MRILKYILPFLFVSVQAQPLVVDLSSNRGAPTGVSSGILLGIFPYDDPPDSFIAPLRMKHHRTSPGFWGDLPDANFPGISGYGTNGNRLHTRLSAFGVTNFELTVNDWNNNNFEPYYSDPIGNIRNIMSKVKAKGWTDIMIDPVNEPGEPAYNSPDLFTDKNFDLNKYIERYKIVARTARDSVPGTKLIGPSISSYDYNIIRLWLDSCHAYTLRTGVNIMPSYVSWHELIRHAEEFFGNPHMYASVLQVQNLLDSLYSSYNIKISVTEYGGNEYLKYSPGEDVDFMAAGERLGVRMIKASWPHHATDERSAMLASDIEPTLGGMLTLDKHGYVGKPFPVPDSVTYTYGKTSVWWAHKTYGDICKPGSVMLDVARTISIDGIASIHKTDKKAIILVGARGAANDAVFDGNQTVKVTNIPAYLIANGKIKAKVQYMPYLIGTLNTLTVLSNQEYTVTSGSATITFTIGARSAASIEITNPVTTTTSRGTSIAVKPAGVSVQVKITGKSIPVSVTIPDSIHVNELFTGTHLRTANYAGYYYDLTTQLPTWAAKHVISITGGTNFITGNYRLNPLFLDGGNRLYNGANLSTSGAMASGTASNGIWSIERGITNGGGVRGTNLIGLYPTIFYDPSSDINLDSVLGSLVTITRGTAGFTLGTYFVDAASNISGLYNTMTLSSYNGSAVPAVTARGGHWKVTTRPVPIVRSAPDPSVTDTIRLMVIGDSNSQYVGNELNAAMARLFPNAYQVINNVAVPSTGLANWQPGQTLYNSAVTTANTNRTKIVSISLGTNNEGTSAATYTANLRTMVDSLYAQIPTLQKVVIHGPITPDAAYAVDMNVAVAGIGHNTTVGDTTGHTFFLQHPILLGDYKHPNNVGYKHWAEKLATGIKKLLAVRSPLTTR